MVDPTGRGVRHVVAQKHVWIANWVRPNKDSLFLHSYTVCWLEFLMLKCNSNWKMMPLIMLHLLLKLNPAYFSIKGVFSLVENGGQCIYFTPFSTIFHMLSHFLYYGKCDKIFHVSHFLYYFTREMPVGVTSYSG